MISHLEKIMQAKGTTIRKLGEDSGINNVTIMRARKNDMIERCTLGKLQQIAKALGVSVHDLFDEDSTLIQNPVAKTEDTVGPRLENHENRIRDIEARLKLLASLSS